MQPSNGCSRIKLNRNAFKLEKSSVPKRRRLSESSGSDCTDPDANVHATASQESSARARSAPREQTREEARRQEPARITGYDQGISAWQHKHIRSHLNLALSFRGSEKSAKRAEAQQSVSCPVSRYVNKDVRFKTSDSIAPNTGSSGRSVANQGVIRNLGVETEKKPVNGDGPAAHLTPDFNRKSGLRKHFGSMSGLGSGRQVKRSIKNSCCALCGDVKYTPPTCNKLTHAYKANSRHLRQPNRLKRSVVHPVAQAKMTTRVIIWLKRHLRVKLCDVAHVFDVTSRDFSCILPAVLLEQRMHKKVKCFSKEYMSLMRLDSGNCGKWIGDQSCEVCTPTNSCASLSLGNQVLGFSVGDYILDTAEHIEMCSESSDKQALGMPDCERIRLSSVKETTDYGAEDLSVASDAKEDKPSPVSQVPPLFLRWVAACNGFVLSKHVDTTDKFIVVEADTNGNCLVENGSNSSSDEGVDLPDGFSCQRTTAVIVRPCWSCARTYRSWPFPRNGPPCELKSVIRSGPRWYVSPDCLKGTRYDIDNMQVDFRTSSECTAEKNLKERPHNEGVVDQNSQGRVQSTKKTEMLLASSSSVETLRAQSEKLKIPEKTLTSDIIDVEDFKHPCNMFQQNPPSLLSVPKDASQALNVCCPKVVNIDKLKVIPARPICAMDNKSVNLDDSSTNRTHTLLPSKRLEDNEIGTEATTLNLSDPLPDLQPSALKTLSHIVHSKEEPHTPGVLVPPSVEVQHPSSVILQFKEEKSQNSLNVLHTTTTVQSTFSTTCTGGSVPDSLSCSDEDSSSMSPPESPEEGASECSPIQDEMSDKAQASRSPSPLPVPEGLAVTGGDLDVMRAYKEDAIVIDVIQDDPDLFGAIVTGTTEQSASKAELAAPGKEKNTSVQTNQATIIRKPNRIVWGLDSKRKDVQTGGDVHLKNNTVLCEGQANELAVGSTSQPTLGTKLSPVNPIVTQEKIVPDCNNIPYNKERTDQYVSTVKFGWTWSVDKAHNNVHVNARKDINIVRPLPPSYCWYYFSEHHACLRSSCWFLHVPREDDEKFCMDIVMKFCRFGGPPIVQRAEEIFVTYYKTNAPGVSFSENIVNQLLSSLLSLALLKDLVSVINTLHTHKRTPPPDFVMALYEHARDRGISNFVPELILLTSKIIEAGCVFSVEQCKMMQLHLESLHVPRHQMDVFCTVKYRALATNPHTAELSDLAQAVVRVELCKQQEDWPALARVFCTVFGGRHSAGELLRFCCCVAMALLKETKDKLTLPYEPFTESVCHEVPTDEMIKSFLARVGVSLMFNYHKNQDWTKAVKLLRVMSRLQIEFALLKGLFKSETAASRCQLVTTATEVFLNSGSIEGALNMLKANEWFVSSNAWPCEQADIQNRTRLLTLLAEKTSYRDTLEVLTNLPGLKQPVDGVHAGEYNTMFNAHLRRCVMNHVLPVGADTLDFMLTHEIPVNPVELQQLIHKLGKQNSWTRARTLFNRAHSAGYYSGVVYERDSLALPCCLTEIEMTLAIEMFITSTCISLQHPSALSQSLLITLKRRSGDEVAMESEYLAAGSRLLSAALIPNPKLSIRYNAVSQEQEQLFNLERGSAAKWLSHNRSWAQGMWASTHTHSHAHSHTDKSQTFVPKN